jgi:hypothetical protein
MRSVRSPFFDADAGVAYPRRDVTILPEFKGD